MSKWMSQTHVNTHSYCLIINHHVVTCDGYRLKSVFQLPQFISVFTGDTYDSSAVSAEVLTQQRR